MSGGEITGWRDQELSARHRIWGFDCPAADIDFLMIEYDHRIPVAAIDYKHVARTRSLDEDAASHEAISKLSVNGSQLPFLLAVYDPATWRFRVSAMNAPARRSLGGTAYREFSELEYVRFLYSLRGRELPSWIGRGLAL